nr:serine protease Hayan-like isoform X1 [Bactrocera oleae]
MANKMVFFGLIVALLQAASTEGANHEPSLDDVPLSIYVDAGKEIDHFISLAKSIDEKQRILEEALARLSAEVKETEQRWNERLSAEVKATEERWTERVSILERKLEDLSNKQRRPAERACEKITNESIGVTSISRTPSNVTWTIPSYFTDKKLCRGTYIDRGFVLTTANCMLSYKFSEVGFFFSDSTVFKEIKATHIHPEYLIKNPLFNNIGLVELDSDVKYTSELLPPCMYTSEFYPKSGLMTKGGKVQIVADSECLDTNTNSSNLHHSQICAKYLENTCTYPGEPILMVDEETIPKYRLFGIVGTKSCNSKPYVITRVFNYLDFIERIVWPKNGNLISN